MRGRGQETGSQADLRAALRLKYSTGLRTMKSAGRIRSNNLGNFSLRFISPSSAWNFLFSFSISEELRTVIRAGLEAPPGGATGGKGAGRTGGLNNTYSLFGIGTPAPGGTCGRPPTNFTFHFFPLRSRPALIPCSSGSKRRKEKDRKEEECG